jgi:chemotaxis protein MotB
MARKRKRSGGGDGGGGDDSFNVLFISLNLILLSFFILLNSISVKDSERIRKALGSLLGTFGVLDGGNETAKTGDSALAKKPVTVEAKSTREDEVAKLVQRLRQATRETRFKIVPTADNIRVEFPDEILFRPSGSEINPELFGTLDSVARVLRQLGREMVVQGFSDPRPPANYPSNLELSGSRAVAVARYLVEAGGVEPKLVRAEGWGVGEAKAGSRRLVKLVIPNRSLQRALEAK